MRVSTRNVALLSAIISTALAASPRILHINIAIDTDTVTTSNLKTTSSEQQGHVDVAVEDLSGATEAAAINAVCDSYGTVQTNPEIDVAAAVSELFDNNTQSAEWSDSAPCATNLTECALKATYEEIGICGPICQGKIRIAARKFAKQNNSKAYCYYGADLDSASAVFDWVLRGSLVVKGEVVVNKVEGQKVMNPELK